jgi:integrase
MATTLTAAGISAAFSKAKKSGKTCWVSDGSVPKSHGGLQLRAEPDGRGRWYWRYSVGEKKIRLALGVYSAAPREGFMTLPEARAEVMAKAALYQAPESKDVRSHLAREQEKLEVQRLADEQAAAVAAAEAKRAKDKTLSKLMAVYVDLLKNAGKQSAGDVANLVKNHVDGAAAAIAAKPANQVTAKEIAAILRPLTARNADRTAAKLRSYLRAAYALAAGAAEDAKAPQSLVEFGIDTNPVAATKTLDGANNTLDRTLSASELQAFWKALKEAQDSVARDSLIVGLACGGQRPAQVVRAEILDFDADAKVLKLRDPKGKRKQARVHALPLIGEALTTVERCVARAQKQNSQLLFSSYGRVALRPDQMSDVTRIISAQMVKDKAVTAPFQLRDIRRTCETLLAGLGISEDVRAQVLSHGLGGVQNKSYNRHSYALEKLAALTKWGQLLEGDVQSASVTELRTGTH